MSRRATAVMAAVLGLSIAVGCNQRPAAPAAKLVGARDLVRVDDLMVVTSSERDELRAIDLEPGEGLLRQFLPAPNPIEPLSIPVLNRPTNLAVDTRWGDFQYPDAGAVSVGVELYGPYVYAASPGTAEISIVDVSAKRGGNALREVARLPTAAPVSALAAFGDVAAQKSTLYFATFDGEQAVLQRLTIAQPSAGGVAKADLTNAVEVLSSLPDTAIIDIVVLPNQRIAYAERAASGRTGDTVVLDVITKAKKVMQFPSPVRRLMTHGRVEMQYCPERACTEPAVKVIEPGDRLFGVLDEEFCGTAACSGVLSVDTQTGQVSADAPGLSLPACGADGGVASGGPCARSDADRQMLPIAFGGLPNGLAVAPGGVLNLPVDGTYGPVALDALGVTTIANGTIVYWQAGQLTPIDVNSAPATLTFSRVINGADGGATLPDGVAHPATSEDGGVIGSLTDALASDEVIFVTAAGALPGLSGLPIVNATMSASVASRAQVGDAVELPGCADGEVTAVGSGTVSVRLNAPDAGVTCTAAVGTVRAAGAQPYVVTGEASGYLGRIGAGQTASLGDLPAKYHPADYDPRAKLLRLSMTDGDLPPKDTQWLLVAAAGFQSYAVAIDVAQGCGTTLPGAVQHDPIRQHTFVAYPSGNSVVEINSPAIVRGTLQSQYFCYR